MAQTKKKSFIQKNGLIAVWSIAGFMAMGYIGLLVSGAGTTSQKTNSVAGNSSSTGNTAVNQPVQQEVAELRARVAELRNREKKLAKKVSHIERTIGPITAAIPETTTGYGIDETPSLAPARVVGPKKPQQRKVSIKVLPLTQGDRLPEFSDTTKLTRYGVELAKARSKDSLERHWDYLVQSNQELLKGLKPQFVVDQYSDLPTFKLVAGPLDLMSKARSICGQLSKSNIDCQETRYDSAVSTELQTAGKN